MSYFLLYIADYYELFAIQFTGKPDPTEISWNVTTVLHCKVNLHYVFLFWELRGLIPNFLIHASVSDLYIHRIGPHIYLQQNRQTNPGNI
jgi:hypothetical protein